MRDCDTIAHVLAKKCCRIAHARMSAVTCYNLGICGPCLDNLVDFGRCVGVPFESALVCVGRLLGCTIARMSPLLSRCMHCATNLAGPHSGPTEMQMRLKRLARVASLQLVRCYSIDAVK